jgi:hypothetical protein
MANADNYQWRLIFEGRLSRKLRGYKSGSGLVLSRFFFAYNLKICPNLFTQSPSILKFIYMAVKENYRYVGKGCWLPKNTFSIALGIVHEQKKSGSFNGFYNAKTDQFVGLPPVKYNGSFVDIIPQ